MANKKLEDTVKKLAEKYGILNNKNLKTVSVGIINDPEIVKYAKVYEYGGIQTVTGKQSEWLYHNTPKGTPVPYPGGMLVQPARPFLRATAAVKVYAWKQELKEALKRFNGDTAKALSYLGQIAATDIKETINNATVGNITFERRKPLTQAIYKEQIKGHKTDGTANMKGDKPGKKTGAMLDAINYQLDE